MRLIDSHAHLDFPDFADLETTVQRAREAGLVHVVVIGQWREGTGIEGAAEAAKLAARDRGFFSATAGFSTRTRIPPTMRCMKMSSS